MWSGFTGEVKGGEGGRVGERLAEGGGDNGAARIAFYDPVPGKSAGVAARIDAAFDTQVSVAPSSDPADYDLVINATAMGLQPGDAPPCDVARMAQ